jgi:hypothetical protein
MIDRNAPIARARIADIEFDLALANASFEVEVLRHRKAVECLPHLEELSELGFAGHHQRAAVGTTDIRPERHVVVVDRQQRLDIAHGPRMVQRVEQLVRILFADRH